MYSDVNIDILTRIAYIHTASEYCKSVASAVQRTSVGESVDPGCHTTDDVDPCPRQFLGNVDRNFFTVITAFPASHDRQCGSSAVRKPSQNKQSDRSVGYFIQPLRKFFVDQADKHYLLLSHLFPFFINIDRFSHVNKTLLCLIAQFFCIKNILIVGMVRLTYRTESVNKDPYLISTQLRVA